MRPTAAGVLFVLGALAANPVAHAQEPTQFDRKEANLGAAAYLRYCAACHGRSGRGDGPVSAGLQRKPTDLTTLKARNADTFPLDNVTGAIDGRRVLSAHGTPERPVWGQPLTERPTRTAPPTASAAAARLVQHVWSIQRK